MLGPIPDLWWPALQTSMHYPVNQFTNLPAQGAVMKKHLSVVWLACALAVVNPFVQAQAVAKTANERIVLDFIISPLDYGQVAE